MNVTTNRLEGHDRERHPPGGSRPDAVEELGTRAVLEHEPERAALERRLVVRGVVMGAEHHEGRRSAPERFQKDETRPVGDLDVTHHDVRSLRFDQREAGVDSGCEADDLDVELAAEQRRESVGYEWMIVDDHQADRPLGSNRGHAGPAPAVTSGPTALPLPGRDDAVGSQTSTVVPPLGMRPIRQTPPASNARSRIVEIPRCPSAAATTVASSNPTPSSTIRSRMPSDRERSETCTMFAAACLEMFENASCAMR